MNTIKAISHLIETKDDNPVNVPIMLLPQKNKLYQHLAGGEFRKGLQMGHKPQHLYLTTDEEIKKGDWMISAINNQVIEAGNGTLVNMAQTSGAKCKKIVASTNPELSQQDDEYSKVKNLAKIDTSFIELFIKAYNEGNPLKEVLLKVRKGCIRDKNNCPFYLEANGLYQNTDEHGTESLDPKDASIIEPDILKLDNTGCVVIYPVEKRMYDPKELQRIASDYAIDCLTAAASKKEIPYFGDWIKTHQ